MLLFGIPVERIRALGDSWSDGGLWNDIVWLSLQTWAAASDGERCMLWHHLVMAVGNFKRQGGRRLWPAHIAPAQNLSFASREDQIRIPDDLLLVCDDLASWQNLEQSLHGAATATTTTLLAALWPERHHILDWRVLAAVAGLDVAADNNSLGLVVDPTSKCQLLPTLDRYCKVRQLLLQWASKADLPVRTVERALYKMSQGVKGSGMTWAEYGRALHEAHGRQELPDTDGTPDDEKTYRHQPLEG